VGLVQIKSFMNDLTNYELLKKILQRLDLTFLSYVGYPPDDEVPYPEEFLEGYHKCIEDFIREFQRLGFNFDRKQNNENKQS